VLTASFFSNQFADARGHGLARYARELWHHLNALDDEITVTPVAAWSSLPADELETLKQETGLQLLPTGHRITPLAWAFLGRPRLETLVPGKVDVVHAASLGYPVATKRPLVVTVHDLGPLTHPQFFSNTRPWVMERSLEQADKQADAIICVSRSTADEVLSVIGAHAEDRIHVVHEGVGAEFSASREGLSAEQRRALNLSDRPFLLTAGKISPRKNIVGVLEAFNRVKDDMPHDLVLVGGAGWETEQVLEGLSDYRLAERVRLLDFVSDDVLHRLYRDSAAYVHPSLYEGFGLTVLEAMASGTPVITSNLTSLPEVAGDAAILLDPTDTEAIADAMLQVCTAPGIAQDLRAKGLARAACFKWEAAAAEVADIYRLVS